MMLLTVIAVWFGAAIVLSPIFGYFLSGKWHPDGGGS